MKTYDKSGSILRPDTITRSNFDTALSCYAKAIASIETNKNDILTLDEFRYVTLPNKYKKLATNSEEVIPLEKEDVVRLVEWKLKHGTFRPGLLQKVQANPSTSITQTTHTAFTTYATTHSPLPSLKTLCDLQGIGPATASLLLSIHSPTEIPFFSDEVFLWLCAGGEKQSIKYNMKEYEQLLSEAQKLMERLEVSALDIERVAFTLMRFPFMEHLETLSTTPNSPSALDNNKKSISDDHSTEKHPTSPSNSSKASETTNSPITPAKNEDQNPKKRRIAGIEEVRVEDTKRLKAASENTPRRVSPRKKLEAAEMTGSAGVRDKVADDVLKG